MSILDDILGRFAAVPERLEELSEDNEEVDDV